MAPSNGTLPWHLTTCHLAMAPYHGIQQWHLTMAPSNGTTSSLSKCVITTPRLLHPAMAPSNGTLPHGTQQWHFTMAPYHMPPSNGTLPWHPAMAPDHGTQQWHHVQSVNGTQQWHHVQSANVCNHPPLLLEVRTSIAKAISGKIEHCEPTDPWNEFAMHDCLAMSRCCINSFTKFLSTSSTKLFTPRFGFHDWGWCHFEFRQPGVPEMLDMLSPGTPKAPLLSLEVEKPLEVKEVLPLLQHDFFKRTAHWETVLSTLCQDHWVDWQ